jgi:hypothetical protein
MDTRNQAGGHSIIIPVKKRRMKKQIPTSVLIASAIALIAVATPVFAAEINMPIWKGDCMDGGWVNYTDNTGTPFAGQGDCVSFKATKIKHWGFN